MSVEFANVATVGNRVIQEVERVVALSVLKIVLADEQ